MTPRLGRWAGALAVAAALAASTLSLASCGLEGYCITCADEDGGNNGDGNRGDGGGGGDGAGPDDGGSADACVPSGIEQCDGRDNDCDGMTDEGTLPGEGEPCGSDVGECTSGERACVDGALACDGVGPEPEICDGLDNDCVLGVDNGDPEGGVPCGTNAGECTAGVLHCLDGGDLQCVGATGAVGEDPELCDGLDNDCDGAFDEDVPPLGTCGVTDVGDCELGQLTCEGGAAQCEGAIDPVLELCDLAGADSDCDGFPSNGFDFTSDTQNCNGCGNVCGGDFVQVADCVASACVVDTCVTGYWDNDDDIGNGCEYGPCEFQGASEACNDADDDCDGEVDEGVVAPANVCDDDGACADYTVECTAAGWVCAYDADVSIDPTTGNIIPETTCDTIDNDCDGSVDESHPLAGEPCDDGANGVCRAYGEYECDITDPLGAVVCTITDDGEVSGPESCNALDDDCNGIADDGALTGALHAWVDIGNGVEMFAYEASRADSGPGVSGSLGVYPCSKPDVQPWTSITHPEAEDACEAIGARLCTESEWNRACSVVAHPSPVVQPNDTNGIVFLETERYDNHLPRSSRAWMPDTTSGYSGTSGMRVSPNTAVDNQFPTGSFASTAPRLDYQVQFTKTGTHYVWVKMIGPNGNDNRVHVGLDGAAVNAADNISLTTGAWTWRGGGTVANISITTTGVHTINLFAGEDGVKVDAILITSSNSFVPGVTNVSSGGCTYAYASSCTVYNGDTCNGEDHDTTAGGTDQDAILDTESMGSCYADWSAVGAPGRIYDLTGNIREWAQQRLDEVNPLRGGASNSQQNGLACSNSFSVADDEFFFPNVGFRCCR
jgi:hypothetical protein